MWSTFIVRTSSLFACRNVSCRLRSRSINRLCQEESGSKDLAELIRNFRKTVTVPSLRMKETDARTVTSTLKSSVIRYFGGLCFARDESQPDFVHILLDPEKVVTAADLGPRALRLLSEKSIPVQLGTRQIELTFEKLTLKQLVAQFLDIPAGLVTFGSTQNVGQVVIVELHDELLPHKQTIARIIIEKKKPAIRAVLNVIGRERTDFRIFPMEVLAKDTEDTSMIAETEAMGCRFRLDFGTVFWNPRRHDEHGAVSQLGKDGDVMYDVFAGVGPFSIPAAKRGVRVLANDFNPECYRWLSENARINEVDSRFTCHQMDADYFIRNVIKEDILKEWQKQDRNKDFHIVMNLPGSATNFLAAFKNWMADRQEDIASLDFINLPLIHIYTFVLGVPVVGAEDKIREVVIKKAEYHVGPIREVLECKCVSFVGSGTRLYRLSFRLPAASLGAQSLRDKATK